ncbi:helix-turn-helix domain-containing protein [Candidatus Microgenomates bacterium]|nr:helix-turn-helix domain-containing protein [Candidatus Microgenomates bacterium]
MKKDNLKEDGTKGLWMDIDILSDPNLSITEKNILAKIRGLDGRKGCYATNAYLGKFFGLSGGQISEYVNKLIRLCYLQYFYFDGRSRYLRVMDIPDAGEQKSSSQDKLSGERRLSKNAYQNNIDINEINNLAITALPKGKGGIGAGFNRGLTRGGNKYDYLLVQSDQILDQFEKIFLGTKIFHKNPTHIKAILLLLDIYGYEGVRELVAFWERNKDIKYYPKISNPREFYEKLVDLICMIIRNHSIWPFVHIKKPEIENKKEDTDENNSK